MRDKREVLYNNLINSGRVDESQIGSLDEFRNAIKDEDSARKFYANLRGAGFGEEEIGDEDAFYSSIEIDFAAGNAGQGNAPMDGDAVKRWQGELYDNAVKRAGEEVKLQNDGDAYKQWRNKLFADKEQAKENMRQGYRESQESLQDRVNAAKMKAEQAKNVEMNEIDRFFAERGASKPLQTGYTAENDAVRVAPQSVEMQMADMNNQQKVFEREEERRIDKEYTPKEVSSPSDIRENYFNRFSLTERGKQLGEELSKVEGEISSRYAKEYLQSDEYKLLQAEAREKGKDAKTQEELDAINDELARKVNKAFLDKYGAQIDDELQPYRQVYQEEFENRYGSQMEVDMYQLNKKQSADALSEMTAKVDGMLASEEKSRKEKADEMRRRFGHSGRTFGGLTSGRGIVSERYDLGAKSAYLRDAKKQLEQAQETLEAAKNGTFASGLGTVMDWDKWTFGVSDMAQAMNLNKVITKSSEGKELTEDEQALMDAALMNMTIQGFYADDLNGWYKAGQVTADSLPFMLEMIANPISGSGNAMAKGLLKYGLKKYALTGAKNKMVKKAINVAANILGHSAPAAVMTGTTSAGRVAAGTVEHLNDNYSIEQGGDGRAVAVRNGKNMGVGEALARSAASTFFENQSEMIFNAFPGAKNALSKVTQGLLPGGAPEFMSRLGATKIGNLWTQVRNNPYMRGMRKRAQIGGIGEEYLEEVYNNFANVLIGEMSMEDATSLENNVDTFLGLVPTQLFFSAMGVGGYAVARRKNNKAIERYRGMLTEDVQREVEAVVNEAIGNPERLNEYFVGLIMDESLTPEQRKGRMELAVELNKRNLLDGIEEAKQADEPTRQEAAMEAGVAAETPEEKHAISRRYEDAVAWREKLTDEDGQLGKYLDDGMKDREKAVNDMMANGFDDRMQEAFNYWAAMDAYEGMAIGASNRVDEAVADANWQAARRAHVDGRIIEATTADRGIVHVKGGNIVWNDDGTVNVALSDPQIFVVNEEGRVEMMSPRHITAVAERGTLQAQREYNNTTLREQLEKQEADEVELNPNTPPVAPGLRFTDVSGLEMVVTSVQDGVATVASATEENYAPVSVPVDRLREIISGQLDAEEGARRESDAAGTAAVDGVNGADGANDGNLSLKTGENEGVSVGGIEQSVSGEGQNEGGSTQTALERVPKDAQGNLLYEEADADTAWDAIVEEAEGDEAVAQEAVSDIVSEAEKELKDAEKALKKAQEAKPEVKGAAPTMAERIAAKKQAKANTEAAQKVVDAAKARLDKWKDIAGTVERRNAAVEAENKRQAEEAARVERERMEAEEIARRNAEEADKLMAEEPQNGRERAAQAIGTGEVMLLIDSYKRETGYGDKEVKGMFGTFAGKEKGGKTIEEAAEYLVAQDEQGFFGGDVQEARNAILDVLQGVRKKSELRNYIANQRKAAADEMARAEREAYEAWTMGSYGMTPEEYENYVQMLEESRPSDVAVEEIRAIFAEVYLEEENRLNNNDNEQERISESVEGSNEVLLGEQADLEGGDAAISERGQGNEAGLGIDSADAASQEEAGGEVQFNDGRRSQRGSSERRSGSSEELDENGRPFVLSSNGTTVFGEITDESGLPAAPIKLSEGYQDEDGKGYGLAHIEANHGEQIRSAGFSSVEEFVSYVAQNYDADNIRVGKRRINGGTTYLIQVTDQYDNTLFIELSRDGSYWNVNSGGIFRKGYSNKKETVAKTEPQQPNNAVSTGSSLSADGVSGISGAEPNGEPTVSEGKGSKSSVNEQGIEGKMFPMTESEFIDARQKELMAENPELDDVDAYNQASDEYPSYIEELIKSGYLEELYADSSIADRVKLGQIVQVAGFETSDISGEANRREKEQEKAKREQESAKYKKGKFVEIRYLDGSIVVGQIVNNADGNVTVRRNDGRVYTVPVSRILDGSTKMREVAPSDVMGRVENIANDYWREREENRRNPLRERVRQWESALGVKVYIVERLDDVTDRAARRAIERGRKVAGWRTANGEVVVYMPFNASVKEIDKTVLHELVGHDGLRGLLGKEGFDALCDKVWDMMPKNAQTRYFNYLGVKDIEDKTERRRAAADEYMANLAEREKLLPQQKNLWNRIVDAIRELFGKRLGKDEILAKDNLKKGDIAELLRLSYRRMENREGENGVEEDDGTRFSVKKDSERRQKLKEYNDTMDKATAFVTGWDMKRARQARIDREQKRKEDAAEIYESVLTGDFNDVTLQKINEYIENATPFNSYGQRISQRLPQSMERGLRDGERTNAVDALFSRICESAVPSSRRASDAGRREIEERKKEALKGWAIATGNWHTDLSDFADESDFISQGTDSKVYLSKDGNHVIKVSFGKPFGKRFRPDIDNVALFNRVFPNSSYEIVGYGEFDGKFARILKQPFVDFADKTAMNAKEREEYMRSLGFEPINDSKTAFSNGTIIAADLQKSNILKDAAGNVSVIDADMKLHTKDVGGDYTYPPVENDLPDSIRFREVNSLVAVHNISEENLRKVMDVGGLIMPSIAITKADMGHSNFGDISLLFDKSTINPSDRRNKVYGGDAWTPRFPKISAKLSEKVVSRIGKKIRELIEDRKLRDVYSLSAVLFPDNIERKLSRYGVEGYYGEEWMKLAYLLDSGKKMKVPMKMKDYGEMSETIIEMAKARGLKVSDIQVEGFDFYTNNSDFVEAVHDAKIAKQLENISEEKREIFRKLMKKNEMSYAGFDSLVGKAVSMEYDLEHGGLKQIIDKAALRDSVEKKVKTNNEAYNKWVDDLFEGIVEKYGIRNNRDWYTPSGDSRPWGQLYDAATPANILKHMLAENEQGGSGGFFDSNIMGASAESYGSIEEIREKGQKRLKKVDDEAYSEWSSSVADRMSEICDEFLTESQKNDIGGSIDAKIAITNAVAKDKTANGIYKEMKKDYPRFTMEHAKRMEAIVKEIQDSAIGYFEAKPQRIVPLSEVRKAIVPSNVSKDILDGLNERGIDVVTYRRGNENSRNRLIKKESEGIRFRELEEVNEEFNENLQKQIDGTLPKGFVYQLGMPSDILLSAGIEDLPIELAASRLVDKSMQENHPFELSEVENLPEAIHNPLAVFVSATKAGSNVILTELKHSGKNFVAALRVRPNKRRIEVNQIRSLYPKNSNGIIDWINNDLATYVDKGRMTEWIEKQKNELLSKPQSNSVEVREQLVSAAKVVEEFENPKLSGENVTRFREANENQAIFVSNAERAVRGIKQEKATPQQWLAMIEKNGGLKAGEDKWLGLSDWLKQKDGSNGSNKSNAITKQEILDFIGENKIVIEEVKYGEGLSEYSNDKLDALNEEFQALIWEGDEETGSVYTSDWVDYAWNGMVERYGDDFESAFEIEGNGTNSALVPTLNYNDEISGEAKHFLGIEDSTEKPINSVRLGYTTEGLENKREIALTVPTIEPWNESDEIHFGDAGEGRAVAWVRFGETFTYENEDYAFEVTEFKEPYRDVNGHDIYKTDSGRDNDFVIYGKGRNGDMIYVAVVNGEQIPVAHKSLDDAKNEMNKYFKEHPVRGRKRRSVLVIDEIQSKRHQEGRENGYDNMTAEERGELRTLTFQRAHSNEYRTAINKAADVLSAKGLLKEQEAHEQYFYEDAYMPLNGKADEFEAKYGKEAADILREAANVLKERENRINELDKKAGKIPSAPFEKNWHELAMKRMLRLAAQEGFDKVAWTTGEQQAERYDLASRVDEIKVTGGADNIFTVIGRKDGGILLQKDAEGEQGLAELLGKDLARKAYSNLKEGKDDYLNEDGAVSFTGDNLVIGGEGMKGFYDKMLPSFVQKYVKKWGAKVGEVELPELEESARKMWSVDVTPEMKESVMEGQTMFREITDDAVRGAVEDFAKRYNMAEVTYVDFAADGAEVLAEDGFTAEDIDDARTKFADGGAGYLPDTGKIYIFAGVNPSLLDSVLWHENVHWASDMLSLTDEQKHELAEKLLADHKILERVKLSEEYEKDEWDNEIIAYGLQRAYMRGIEDYLGDLTADKNVQSILNYIGYGKEKRDSELGTELLVHQNGEGASGEGRFGRGNRPNNQGEKRSSQRGRTADYGERILDEVVRLEEELGSAVNAIDSFDALPEGRAKDAIAEGRKVLGWYQDGRVYVYMPNARSAGDVRATVYHEVVGHLGLRELLGDRFNKFLDRVYMELPADVRAELNNRAMRKGWDFREATEEYMAELAERFARGEKVSGLRKVLYAVRDAVVKALRSLGIDLGFEMSDNYLMYVLWASKQNLKPSDVMGRIADRYMRNVLNVEGDVVRPTPPTRPTGTDGSNGADGVNGLRYREIEEVNERFNEELGKLNESNADKIQFDLGRPSNVLRAAGVEDRPMKLYGNKVVKKMKKHGFALEELANLPMAVAAPIAVFKNYGEEGNRSILTELKTEQGNFLVTLSLGKGHDIDFNIVTSVFGKGEENIIDWIEKGYGVYFDKKKTLDYLHHSALKAVTSDNRESNNLEQHQINALRINPVDYIDDNALDSAAKVVENFENPKVEGENQTRFREIDAEESDGTREDYAKRVRTGQGMKGSFTSYNAQEAFQDEMLSLKIAQEIVEKKAGRKLASYENAYMAENRLSSINKRERDEFIEGDYEKMMDFIDEWIDDKKETPESINAYVFAKSGLERNREFAVRDALAKQLADEELTEEEAKRVYEAYKRDRDELRLSLKTGRISYEEFNRLSDDAVKRHALIDSIDDYSGLQTLTGDEKGFRDKAEKIVLEFEKRHGEENPDFIPEYEQFWEAVRTCTRAAVKKQYDSGMIPKSQYDHVTQMFEWYIPLRGFNEKTAEDVYDYVGEDAGTSTFSPTLKKAKGRKSLPDDPFATIANMMQSAILQGNRNKMKQHFLNMVQNTPTDLFTVADAWLVKTLIEDEETGRTEERWVDHYAVITENMTPEEAEKAILAHEESMKELEKQGKAMRKKTGLNIDYKIANPKNVNQHVVVVKRGGKEFVIYVNGNPRVAQALNGMLKDTAENIIVKIWDKYTRFYSATRTSYNIDFVLANLVRDWQHAFWMTAIQNGGKDALSFAVNSLDVAPALLRGVSGRSGKSSKQYDRYFEEFLKNGGETGYSHITSVEEWKEINNKRMKRLKGMAKAAQAGKNVLPYMETAFSYLNRIAEDLTRFNVYVLNRKKGEDIATSIQRAKDITVNFNKKGSGRTNGFLGGAANIFRRWMPFANPIVQGITQFLRVSKEHKVRMGSILFGHMAAGFLVPFLNAYLLDALGGDDDDDYMNQSDHSRRNNLMIYTGGGYIKLPLPPMFREVYGLGDVFYCAVKGYLKPGKAALETVNMIRNMFSLGGQSSLEDADFSMVRFILPTQVGMFVDIAENVNFMGAPIYKETPWDEYVPEHKKVYKGTWSGLVWASAKLNELMSDEYADPDMEAAPGSSVWMNPAVWQHIINESFGGPVRTLGNVGGLIMDAASGELEENFTWSTVPVGNRFYTSPTDRTKNAATNRRYYDVKKYYDRLDRRSTQFEKRAKNGDAVAAELLSKFRESDDYKWYMMLKKDMDEIEKESRKKNKAADPTAVDKKITELKKKVVDEVYRKKDDE